MLSLWEMAKAYGTPPSRLLHVGHPLAAFYLDRAINAFGAAFEHDLRKSQEGAKKSEAQKAMAANAVRMRWLGTGQFASVPKSAGRRA